MAENPKQNLQPTSVIAMIFGVTNSRIGQLKKEGVIVGHGNPAKYDLLPTVKAYIRYLSDKAYGREQKENMARLEEEKLQAETNIKKAKAEIAIARADEQIALEKKKAENEIRTQIAEVSVVIAEQLIDREINEKDHEKLINDMIDNVKR